MSNFSNQLTTFWIGDFNDSIRSGWLNDIESAKRDRVFSRTDSVDLIEYGAVDDGWLDVNEKTFFSLGLKNDEGCQLFNPFAVNE